ncbi:tryptophan-rich sensory protein [Leptolyngbya sp. FACHB-261]|uniref:TspO/MBR family protein n=1 Tax=Leptolyngbya sp. FACHB-261 TaxID=2692806 RepID=UPI0016880551|nr:tryptophan-rich sensory protein [Leptolyngbya sp. FACHB-261]MBD2100214.1 tryptophan-rich sensory protein [Leptolyngbya sp. FACHB-261]
MIDRWVIGGITAAILIGGGGVSSLLIPKDHFRWFMQLRRPRWLVFEPLIPFIWTLIFVCGAISAMLVWEQDRNLTEKMLLMALYFLVAALTISFNPVVVGLKSLQGGLIVGGAATVLVWLLTLLVWRISGVAALLLVPYVIWGPIGTYVTGELQKLNPRD